MNEYLERKRRAQKPIQPAPSTAHRHLLNKRQNALEQDAPKGREHNARDGLAHLLAAGARAFGGQQPESGAGGLRRYALRIMRAKGKWLEGNPEREEWWQNPETEPDSAKK